MTPQDIQNLNREGRLLLVKSIRATIHMLYELYYGSISYLENERNKLQTMDIVISETGKRDEPQEQKIRHLTHPFRVVSRYHFLS